jgi:hypothetical protein
MPVLHKIKLGTAVVLLCATCLPLSECSTPGNANRPHTASSITQRLFPRNDAKFTYDYAAENIGVSATGALTLLAFLWPLLFSVMGIKLSQWRFAWIVSMLELLLCAGTIWWLYFLTAFSNRWLYGAYVVIVVVSLYGCAVLLRLFHLIRAVLVRRRGLTNRSSQLRRRSRAGSLPGV